MNDEIFVLREALNRLAADSADFDEILYLSQVLDERITRYYRD